MFKPNMGRQDVGLHPLTLVFDDAEREGRFRHTHDHQVLRQTRMSLLLGVAIYLLLGIEDPWFFPNDFLWVWGVRAVAAAGLMVAFGLTWYPPIQRRLQCLLFVITLGAGVGPLLMLWRGGAPVFESYAVGTLMVIVWSYTLAGLRFMPALLATTALVVSSVGMYWGWLDVAFFRVASVTLHLLTVGILAGAAGYMIEQQWRRSFVWAEWLDAERQNHAHQALHDALTGLPNRHSMHARLEEVLGRARRSGKPFSLLFIDLNDFKPINDRFGHRVGDQVLIELATRLRGTVREVDFVARLGGDEFVVLAEDVTAVHAAEHLAPKILEVIGRGVAVVGADQSRILRITASIGIASYPMHGEGQRQLLQNADLAMYRAKAVGGGIAAHDGTDQFRSARS